MSSIFEIPVWLDNYFVDVSYNPWTLSCVASILIGISGILPLYIIPLDYINIDNEEVHSPKMKLLLSFAVGGLLSDVFLHLLPEAWEYEYKSSNNQKGSGLLVLSGLLLFVLVEIIFSNIAKNSDSTMAVIKKQESKVPLRNGCIKLSKKNTSNHISGYLNLIANFIDNFTHGLAVAGSFLVSLRLGILSTFAILVHEIPHEVGDFAILLKSGFTRWEAVKGQLVTAFGGLLGAFFALTFSGVNSIVETKTSWIVPFTAGGFLHIALVTVLPDLLKEDDFAESLKQVFAIIFGIVLMGILISIFP